MSNDSDASSNKSNLAARILWGLVYLFVGYVLCFVLLLTDIYVFEGGLFVDAILIRFPDWEQTIGELIGTLYFPLIKPLEALHLL
jgi:hypothetical protein